MRASLALLVACGPLRVSLDQPGETGDAVEPVGASHGETAAPAEGPGLATLDCATSPPADGKVDCALRLADAGGEGVWEGPAGVGLHGRSSQDFPKPQFAIELRDADGLEASADLYGMGAEADWLLNGLYIDRALLRNKLCYDLHRALTADREWAPESTYVELTYRGDYFGVYLLTERVDHGPGRTPMPDDDGTGASFIVRAAESGIRSTLQYGLWEVAYPAASAQTPAVMGAIAARLAGVEAAIASSSEGTWEEVDRDSAVAFVLMEEFVKNNDAFFLSHHAYTGHDGRIRFTPWDVDLSLGQPSYNDNENPRSWIAYRPALITGLGAAPGFQDRMTTMWAEWRAGGLADGAIDAALAALPALLGDATDRNFARWPIGDIQFSGYLYAVSSYDEELARVAGFVHERLTWMDENVAAWSSGP